MNNSILHWELNGLGLRQGSKLVCLAFSSTSCIKSKEILLQIFFRSFSEISSSSTKRFLFLGHTAILKYVSKLNCVKANTLKMTPFLFTATV